MASPVTTQHYQHQQWSFSLSQGPILGSHSMEALESKLGFTCPEMIFGDNRLVVQHASGWCLSFIAEDALERVDKNPSSLHNQVAYAEHWQEKNLAPQRQHVKDVVKPYDWTYTSDYMGTVTYDKAAQDKMQPTTESIDINRLKQPDPILFYGESILYEDELADNGTSILSVKIASLS